MSVKCVIFDFNGTLFFDYKENKDSWNEISIKYRGRPFQEDEYLSMIGMTDRAFAAHITGETDERKLDEVGHEKEEIYLDMCRERGLQVEKDAILFIEECIKRGVKIMIASSAPKENMDWYIENLGLTRWFRKEDIIAGRYDIPSKPSPDIYIYTQKLSGFAKEDCIAFEDGPGGIRSALGAEFRRVYAVLSPGVDTSVTGKLAPLVDWKYVKDNTDLILS